MVELRRAQRSFGRLIYVGLALLLILLSLAPIDSFIRDLFPMTLFAVTYGVMLRSPKLVPLWVIAIVFLFRDVVFFLPVGVEALIVVLILHVVRNARRGLSETMFKEWGGFAIAMLAFVIARTVILLLLINPITSFDLLLLSAATTIAIYPLVPAFLAVQFGLRKPLAA